MRLVGCQLEIAWENPPANCAKVHALCSKAEIPPGSLIVLPEMFATGFSMHLAATLEQPPSETERFVESLAREHQSWVIAGMIAAGKDGKGRNEAVVFSPEGFRIARYCKWHPFPLAGEQECHEAGEEIVTFDWNGLSTAPFICYDLRFPELFRAGVRQGAQLFAVMANWPSKRHRHWINLLQARAIENQAYVIGVNRCGSDPMHQYTGQSVIIDPHGEIVADAGEREGIISAEVDVACVTGWRKEFPALRDMR
jgi:omega-amidase